MRRVFWGIIVILIGLWVWAGTLGLAENYRFGRNWPLLLVLLGAYIIYRSVRRWARRRVRKVDVLDELEKGRIDVDEAVERLKQGM
jgi:hypothetical protein